MISSWYRNYLLPRLVFIPFWMTLLALIPLRLIRLATAGPRSADLATKLCMEAGERGWELIEFKELYTSACEYLGRDHVHKVIINRDEDYLTQIKRVSDQIHPTHYVYDPRTGSQRWLSALWQSFMIAALFTAYGITPICILTDVSVRIWRAQCAIVSAKTGVVISFMSPRRFYPIFPHRRLVAPALMPFSEATLNYLDELSRNRMEMPSHSAIFVGSLYEPRTAVLHEIKDGLAARGFMLDIKGREQNAPRSSDFEYWSRLINATLVITTTDQIVASGMDWTWFPQVVYRYLEATASGTLLVAPDVPGIRRFFTPGEHFVSFTSPAHAIDVIAYYLANEKERNDIAQKGKDRAHALIRARISWIGIDIGLGVDSLT